jgi:hypothetical protein
VSHYDLSSLLTNFPKSTLQLMPSICYKVQMQQMHSPSLGLISLDERRGEGGGTMRSKTTWTMACSMFIAKEGVCVRVRTCIFGFSSDLSIC